MSTTDTASEKISISTKDLSAEDRKMLRGIFFTRSTSLPITAAALAEALQASCGPSGLPSSVSTRIKNSVAMPWYAIRPGITSRQMSVRSAWALLLDGEGERGRA